FLRVAGARINPRTNGPQLPPRYTAFTLVSLSGGKKVPRKMPTGAPGAPVWSPDGQHFAVTRTTARGIELWLGSPTSDSLRRVKGVTLNGAYGVPLQWLPDGKRLLCQTISGGRGAPPAAPAVPPGPTIQESSGKAGPVRTFQDLLRNAHDEDLFDHYCTSQ